MTCLIAQLVVLAWIAFKLGVNIRGDKEATDYIASVLLFVIDGTVLYFAGAFSRIIP